MAEQIKAKMKVWTNEPGSLDAEGNKASERVVLSAVYSPDPNSENYSYSQATPNANLNMYISNKEAFDFFKQGEEFIVTFEKAPKPETTGTP